MNKINVIDTISLPKAIGHQLLPGMASLALFIPSAYVLNQNSWPILFALVIGIVFGEVPVSWWLMISRVKKETGGRFDFSIAFPWRANVGIARYLYLGIPAIVVSIAVMGIGTGMFGPALKQALFTAWPE